MVFMGVMVYSGIRSYMDGMVETGDVFYKENNAQDLDVVGANFSKEDLDKIKSLDNVNNAERKLTIVANMEADEDRTLQLNFIESNDISKFYVADGVGFDKNAEYNKQNDNAGCHEQADHFLVGFITHVSSLLPGLRIYTLRHWADFSKALADCRVRQCFCCPRPEKRNCCRWQK